MENPIRTGIYEDPGRQLIGLGSPWSDYLVIKCQTLSTNSLPTLIISFLKTYFFTY
jgi:hypothetical protein